MSESGGELFDVHTHVGVDLAFLLRGWWPYANTTQNLLERMDRHGIDRAVCFPFTLPSAFDPYRFADDQVVELIPGRVPFDRENVCLLDEVQRIDTAGRLLAFAMFDPARCVDKQLANLEPLAGRIGGLKLQGTVLESPVRALLGDGRGLMAFAEQHDLPVLIHTAVMPGDDWAQVADCLDVAAAYPNVRFNLAHSLRFHDRHLRTAAGMANVWVDCAAHLAHCQGAVENAPYVAPPGDRLDADYTRPTDVLAAVYELLGDRYLWGSDDPFMSWCDDTIRSVYSYAQEAEALHALPASVRRSMAAEVPRAWLFGKRQDKS